MSYIVCSRHPLVADLIKSLGLKGVKSLTLHFTGGDVATVTAEFFPQEDQIEPVFKKYALSAVALKDPDQPEFVQIASLEDTAPRLIKRDPT